MKLIHVVEILDLAMGGPSVATAGFAAAQALQGHDVAIVCYDSPGLAGALASFRHYPAFERVQIHAVPRGGRLEAYTASAAGKVFATLFPGADVVSVHGLWRPMLGKSIRIARQLGVAYSIVPHGMLDPWSFRQKAWKKKPAWWLGWRRHCDRATFIRVLNADEARLLQPLALKAPLRSVPNGVFPEDYAALPAPGGFYRKYPQLRGRPYILFLSRLHYKKGLDYLIEAFAQVANRLDEVDLVVAGPDDGALQTLEQDIARHRLGERAHVVGPLYGEEKFMALVDAACFCLPSRQEGFSIAITEALASGTPVVISEACNFPEVAQANAGKVVGLNAGHIAAALLELLESPAQREAAGRAGRDLVLRHFSWQAVVAGWEAHVRELRAAGARPRW